MNLRRKTKDFLTVWSLRLLFVAVGALILWANIHRFRNNTFSNYEKAVDYGRVREEKESIEPVIAAIFYEERHSAKDTISSYLDHSGNYRRNNVKIIAVPTDLSLQGESVVETLYRELSRQNKISKILLVEDNRKNINIHKKLLQKNIKGKPKITVTDPDEFSPSALDESETIAVVLTDMKNGVFGNEKMERLAEIAGRRGYKTQVFDVIDTEMAEAAGKNYSELFTNNIPAEESELMRQKNNLLSYKKNYETALLDYFKLNFRRNCATAYPEKNLANYRLYDRGNIYVRLFGEEKQELFSRAKIGKNKGIVVSLVEVASKASIKLHKKVKYVKIYLLTDMEPLGNNLTAGTADYLDDDDGIYVRYKNKKAIMAADEIAENKDVFADILRKRAKIPLSAKDDEIKLYKFKTVEMEYEN